MNIRALIGSNGELSVFIPIINPNGTALPPDEPAHPKAVASRPGHPPHRDPAGDFLRVLKQAFGRD